MAKRAIMRIELTPAAKKRLSEMSSDKGMTQVSVASRLVQWFAMQPEAIQAAVLGQYPAEYESEIIRMILEDMTQKQKKKSR
jgi:DNA-binding TFAR19-related protein (PDSD5 family)